MEQYFHVVLLIMLYKMVLTVKSDDHWVWPFTWNLDPLRSSCYNKLVSNYAPIVINRRTQTRLRETKQKKIGILLLSPVSAFLFVTIRALFEASLLRGKFNQPLSQSLSSRGREEERPWELGWRFTRRLLYHFRWLQSRWPFKALFNWLSLTGGILKDCVV